MKKETMLLNQFKDYQQSEESFIVSIIKTLATDIDMKDKWIDVVAYDCWRWKETRPCFNYFVFELFERKIKPVYTRDATALLKRALTWEAAHNDIEKQRSGGLRGPMFLTTCPMLNLNRGRKETIYMDFWNEEYGGFDHTGKVPTTTIAKVIDMKPNWEYKITGIEPIDDLRLQIIRNNYSDIAERIQQEKRVKIEWFMGNFSHGKPH